MEQTFENVNAIYDDFIKKYHNGHDFHIYLTKTDYQNLNNSINIIFDDYKNHIQTNYYKPEIKKALECKQHANSVFKLICIASDDDAPYIVKLKDDAYTFIYKYNERDCCVFIGMCDEFYKIIKSDLRYYNVVNNKY
jgi:hypothetical protein